MFHGLKVFAVLVAATSAAVVAAAAAVESVESAAMVYVGPGGCDVADHDCQPPTAGLDEISLLRIVRRGSYPTAFTHAGKVHVGGLAVWLATSSSPESSCLFVALADKNIVASFSLSANGTALPVSRVDSGGLAPVYLEAYKNVLLVANYHGPDTPSPGATVASFTISPGTCLLSLADSIAHNGHSVNPARQGTAHVHSFVPGFEVDGQFFNQSGPCLVAFAADLGMDYVYTYLVVLSSGKMVELSREAAPTAGYGPRHIAVDPVRKNVYVVFEMGNTVGWYSVDQSSGKLSLKGTISAIPSHTPITGFTKAAEILLHQRYLYVTNRGSAAGSNSVVSFSLDDDGKPGVPERNLQIEGRWPRGINYLPLKKKSESATWFVAGQGSGNLAVYNGSHGVLDYAGLNITGLCTPVTIAVLEL